MKSVLVYLIIGLFLFIQNSYAQSATCRGRIIDGVTKEAISHATVQWKGADKGVATNSKGEFEIASTSQSQSLVVTCIGYQSFTMLVSPQQSSLVIALQSGNNTMPEVVISANRDVARR